MSSWRIVRANSSTSWHLAFSKRASSLSRTLRACSGLSIRDANASACPAPISPRSNASRVFGKRARPPAVLAALRAWRPDMLPDLRNCSATSPSRRASSATTAERRATTNASTLDSAAISAFNAATSNPATTESTERPPRKQPASRTPAPLPPPAVHAELLAAEPSTVIVSTMDVHLPQRSQQPHTKGRASYLDGAAQASAWTTPQPSRPAYPVASHPISARRD